MVSNSPLRRSLKDASKSKPIATAKEEVLVSETASELNAITLLVSHLGCDNRGHVNESDLKPLLVQLYSAICSLADYQRESESSADSENEGKSQGTVKSARESEDGGEDGGDSMDGDADADSNAETDTESDDDCGFWPKPKLSIEDDGILLGTWRAVLEPIYALSRLEPEGPFLAARMILFTQHALSMNRSLPHCLKNDHQNRQKFQLQADLGQDLDEALLIQLRKAWERGGRNDSLSWVSTYLEVDNSRSVFNDYNMAVMSACSPSAFWMARQEAAKYLIKVRRPSSPDPFMPPGGEAPSASHGPIGPTLFNTLVEGDHDIFSMSGIRGPCLRRSHYFIQDIRQMLASAVPQERLELAMSAIQGKLPAELQQSITKYANPSGSRVIHPYLARLDIGTAYTPLPNRDSLDNMECDECTKACLETADPSDSTCPKRSIYIWNVALRAFHTFHRVGDGRLFMCKHQGICKGHHTDYGWRVTRKEDVRQYALDIFETRCHVSSLPDTARRWFEAMTTINPHTNPESFKVPNAPHSTPRLKFYPLGLETDEADQRYRREGGRCGIVSSMVYSYVHTHGPYLDSPLDATTAGAWAYGKSMEEEEEVAKALLDLADI